jgi:hypothetical protein
MVPLTPPLEGALAVALCGVEFEMRTGADGRSRWRQVLGSHWSHIQPGDTQDRVRQFLGPPDEDLPAATGGDASAIVWKYGKPNEEYQGRVVFSGGTVTRCEPPPPATSRWLPVET